MSEHYTEGRRYSHISQAWILEASWNDQEEIAYLRSQVTDLTAKLAVSEKDRERLISSNQHWHTRVEQMNNEVEDLTRRLEEAQALVKRYAMCGHDHSTAWWQIKAEDAEAKLAAVEQERDTMRTTLRALPVVVKELEQALDVLDGYYDGAEDSSIKWLGEPMYYVRNAKERLAQAMRGGK